MSAWSILFTERVGSPDSSWDELMAPDAATLAGLHTLTLDTDSMPMGEIAQSMEREMLHASLSSVDFDFIDKDGTLADQLGPLGTLASDVRYFGPWVTVTESWDGGSAVRFFGYMDELSLEWDEDTGSTKFTALPADQLLSERQLIDIPEIFRAYPMLPTGLTQTFAQSDADTILHAVNSAYTVPGDHVSQEKALWVHGKLSWYADAQKTKEIERDTGGKPHRITTAYGPPSAVARSLVINGIELLVDHVEWLTTKSTTTHSGDPLGGPDSYYEESTMRVALIVLQGAPDLTNPIYAFDIGSLVSWGIAEETKTHYVLRADIPAPASGSDGQLYMDLTATEYITPGDDLVITRLDESTSAARRTETTIKVIDVDGEINRVFTKDPFQEGITMGSVSKIRRNSKDPVLVDAVVLAAQIVAPFTLDTTQLFAAKVSLPVVSWAPVNVATPQLFAVHDVQGLDLNGKLRFSRRGAIGGGGSTVAGVWEGDYNNGFLWKGSKNGNSTALVQYGQLAQWPAYAPSNSNAPPVIWTMGDLSGGRTKPDNGWRHFWRTWRDLSSQEQTIESSWDGANITWGDHAPSGGPIPNKLVHFMAQSAAPGKYVLTSGGVWSFQAHTGPETLGSAVVPSVTGSMPAGHLLALGLGAYNTTPTSDEQEAMLLLSVANTSVPFGVVQSTVLSQDSSGNLTVRDTQTLTTSTAGVWSLGGGLVVNTYLETVGDKSYPHSKVYFVDGTGTAALVLDLFAVEIIPQSIQPLTVTGVAASRTIPGWWMMGLESYEDSDNAVFKRRLRFIRLDATLAVVNGAAEVDARDPINVNAYYKRGDVVADPVADGAIPCRMVRTGVGDRMAGFIGGRLFHVDTQLSRTLERVKMDGLDAQSFIEDMGVALMATTVQNPDGSIALISRRAGKVQTRDLGGGVFGGVAPGEAGHRSRQIVAQAQVSEVNIGYANFLTDSNETSTTPSGYQGGKPLDIDLSAILGSATAANAIGQALAYYFGDLPLQGRKETWSDLTVGPIPTRTPPFWASYKVGDIIPENGASGASVVGWKLLEMTWRTEEYEVDVTLSQVPDAVSLSSSDDYFVPDYTDTGFITDRY